MNKKIALFGDAFGINQLLTTLEKKNIACFVVAKNRPQNYEDVKTLGDRNDIPVFIQPFQSEQSEQRKLVEKFEELQIEIIISNSYSMLIPSHFLNLVEGNAFNIHWSLLPRNKGPNPIQWCLIKGEKQTGVTIHRMNNSFDDGAVLFQNEIEIEKSDTWVTLHEKLVKLSELIIKEKLISTIINNESIENIYNESQNIRLDAEWPKLCFSSMTDEEVYNIVRAQVSPLKGAYIEQDNQRIHFENKLSLEEIAELRNRYSRKNKSTQLSIHQPSYIPWLGYFFKIAMSDVFVFHDNVEYSKNTYTKRVLIRKSFKEKLTKYLSIPLKQHSDSVIIKDLYVDNSQKWRQKHLNQIKETYRKFPFFNENFEKIEHIFKLSEKCTSLCEVNLLFIKEIMKILDLKSQLIFSSELEVGGSKHDYNMNIVQSLNADIYISGTGAKSYQEKGEIPKNVQIIYHDLYNYLEENPYADEKYFMNGLSIIDALFLIGTDGINQVFKNYGKKLDLIQNA